MDGQVEKPSIAEYVDQVLSTHSLKTPQTINSILISSSVVATFFSCLFVNLDFFKLPDYYLNWNILISPFMYIIGSLNLMYILVLVFCAFWVMRYGFWIYFEQTIVKQKIFQRHGISFLALIRNEITTIKRFLFYGSFIGIGCGFCCSLFFDLLSNDEEIYYGYQFPFFEFDVIFSILLFVLIVLSVLFLTFACSIIALIVTYYQYSAQELNTSNSQDNELGFSLSKVYHRNQKIILQSITTIIAIIAVICGSMALFTTGFYYELTVFAKNLYTLDLFFNLLPLIFLVILEGFILIPKVYYQKICYLILFVIGDSFLAYEIALATNYFQPMTVRIVSAIPGDTLIFYLFIIFSFLSILEILANKLYGAFGFFTILGIAVTKFDVYSNVFLMILSLFALLVFLVGFANLTHRIIANFYVALTPLLKDLFGRNQGFLSPRLLGRQSLNAKIMLAFLFFTVTLGLMTNASYPLSLSVNMDNAYWQVGADIRFGLTDEALYQTVPKLDIDRIKQYPDVQSATRVYLSRSYYTGFNADDNITELILIEPLKFLQTGFFRDNWFIGGTAEYLLNELEKDSTAIILDADRAEYMGKTIGDAISIRHSSGAAIQTFSLHIIGLVKFFILGYDSYAFNKPNFGIMNIKAATPVFTTLNLNDLKEKNPTTCYLVKKSPQADIARVNTLIQNLLNDSAISYLADNRVVTFNSVLRNMRSAQQLHATPQILGSLSICSLVCAAFGCLFMNVIITREENHDYMILRILGLDYQHFFYVFAAENLFRIITILMTSYVASMFISIALNMLFLPHTSLPVTFVISDSIVNYQIIFSIILIISSQICAYLRTKRVFGAVEHNIGQKALEQAYAI